MDQSQLDGLRHEVFDIIFNDWLLRQFRSNLQRMDRANPLGQLLVDIEEVCAPKNEFPTGKPKPATA